MAFERGLGAIDKAAAEAASGFGPRLGFQSWKDKDRVILRFLTDDVIVGPFAEYIVTNKTTEDGKERTADFLIDPDGTNWVEYFGGKQREYGTGALVDPKLRKLGVGVAVVREEKPTEGGRVQIVDQLHTIDVDGKKYTARKFVIVKMSIGNFWDQLRGMGRRAGTICDRDFEISRRGADKNTKYDMSPIDPRESAEPLEDLEALHAFYGYGKKWDEQDPDRFLFCPQTLDEWAEGYSGKERAEFFLGNAKPQEQPPQPNGNAAAAQAAPRTVVVDQDGTPLVQTTAHAPSGSSNGWGSSDHDEANAVPSTASGFADVRNKLKSSFATT